MRSSDWVVLSSVPGTFLCRLCQCEQGHMAARMCLYVRERKHGVFPVYHHQLPLRSLSLLPPTADWPFCQRDSQVLLNLSYLLQLQRKWLLVSLAGTRLPFTHPSRLLLSLPSENSREPSAEHFIIPINGGVTSYTCVIASSLV